MYWKLIAILTGVVIVCFLMYLMQDKILYLNWIGRYSESDICSWRRQWNQVEEVKLETRDGQVLHCTMHRVPDSYGRSAPTLLHLHGNAGNVYRGCPNTHMLSRVLGVNVFCVEYRGYGNSTGRPSEKGLYEDGESTLMYLRDLPDIDRDKIIVYGESLGGGVAVHVASLHPTDVAGLILVNTFTSIPGVVFGRWTNAQKMLSGVVSNKFDNLSKVTKLLVPTLILYSEKDEMMPPEMALKLYEKCGSRHKYLAQLSNVSHNTFYQSDEFYTYIMIYLSNIGV